MGCWGDSVPLVTFFSVPHDFRLKGVTLACLLSCACAGWSVFGIVKHWCSSIFLSADPGWGSCSLGVFICLACSGIHRNITNVSKVKSLSLSHWEDHEIKVRPSEPAATAAPSPHCPYKLTSVSCELSLSLHRELTCFYISFWINCYNITFSVKCD